VFSPSFPAADTKSVRYFNDNPQSLCSRPSSPLVWFRQLYRLYFLTHFVKNLFLFALAKKSSYPLYCRAFFDSPPRETDSSPLTSLFLICHPPMVTSTRFLFSLFTTKSCSSPLHGPYWLRVVANALSLQVPLTLKLLRFEYGEGLPLFGSFEMTREPPPLLYAVG